jgi:hypothetical protein
LTAPSLGNVGLFWDQKNPDDQKKRLVADAVSPNRSQHSEFPANRENNREAYEKWRFGPKLTAGIFDLSVA